MCSVITEVVQFKFCIKTVILVDINQQRCQIQELDKTLIFAALCSLVFGKKGLMGLVS